jgi:hypothetical protein
MEVITDDEERGPVNYCNKVLRTIVVAPTCDRRRQRNIIVR